MIDMTAKEVQQKLEAGEILNIIDVREPTEVEEGHIKGITHIPLGELEERIGELDKNTEYIMVCRSGARSGKAKAYLQEHGYKAINMAGGMLSWEGETI
jgi:rhodanese-related sulfurtransferase